MSEKLDLDLLMSSLNNNNNEKNYIKKIDNSDYKKEIKEFQINKKIKKIEKLPTKLEQKLERQENYKIIKEGLQDWDPIVKVNRIAEQIDYRDRDILQNNNIRIQNNSNNNLNKFDEDFDFKNKLMSKLKEKNLDNHQELTKRENEKMKNLKKNDQEKNIQNLRKQKELLLYKEVKDKRVKKIKSKLYRRIRKKKLTNEELDKEALLMKVDKDYNLEVMEKQERRRAMERCTLKHRNDIKYAKQLKRYADIKAYQNTITNLEKEKKEIKKKVENYNNDNSDVSILSDDSDIENQAYKKLEEELVKLDNKKENSEEENFVDKIINQNKEKAKGEIKFLINKIKNKDYDDFESEQEEESEEYDDYGEIIKKEKIIKKPIEENNLEENGRINYESEKNLAKLNNPIVKNDLDLNKNIIDNIEINNLEKKYKKNFKEKDINMFLEEDAKNNNELYDNLNFNVLTNLNKKEFEEEKFEDIKEELNEDDYVDKKGWGSWTGLGIKEVPNFKKENLRKEKIEELKKKRKDNKNKEFIINEETDKNFDKYLIKKLPHPFKNKYEYEKMNEQSIGSEWIGMNNHKNMIKGNISTLDGQVIQPISKNNIPKSKYL